MVISTFTTPDLPHSLESVNFSNSPSDVAARGGVSAPSSLPPSQGVPCHPWLNLFTAPRYFWSLFLPGGSKPWSSYVKIWFIDFERCYVIQFQRQIFQFMILFSIQLSLHSNSIHILLLSLLITRHGFIYLAFVLSFSLILVLKKFMTLCRKKKFQLSHHVTGESFIFGSTMI